MTLCEGKTARGRVPDVQTHNLPVGVWLYSG
jgi:hypothetical protein